MRFSSGLIAVSNSSKDGNSVSSAAEDTFSDFTSSSRFFVPCFTLTPILGPPLIPYSTQGSVFFGCIRITLIRQGAIPFARALCWRGFRFDSRLNLSSSAKTTNNRPRNAQATSLQIYGGDTVGVN